MGLYSLAHALHKTVGEIEMMTHSEYLGWHEYFLSLNKESKPKEKNLLDDPEALMKGLL
jgi:hypothetical protein